MVVQTYGLEHFEFNSIGEIHRNLTVQELVEHQYTNNEGKLGPNGVMMIETGNHTRCLKDCKYYVDEPSSSEKIWWGPGNRSISPENYATMKGRVLSFLSGKKLYIQDGFAGAAPRYRIPVRIVSEMAWHAHVFSNHLLPATDVELENFQPEITVLNAAGYLEYEFEKYDLTAKEFVLLNVKEGLIIIGGTAHSDEIKAAVFSMMNYLLPLKGVLTLHAAASIGKENDVALIIGSPETGKTSLVHDPNKRSWHRRLISDDSTGWSEEGVLNLENGCYARTHNLSRELEPDIFQAIRFGAILENGSYDVNREIDLMDGSRTTNARLSYPQAFVHNAIVPGLGDHPRNLILLCNDMSGVLPPVAKLSIDQAVYYFLAGYSCRVFIKDRQPVFEQEFSACFGSTFMPLRPNVYAELLARRMEQHEVKAFLVNTGTTGGPLGSGRQISILITRGIIEAVLDHTIENAVFEADPVFGFEVPKQLAGVDSNILDPRNAWDDPAVYEKARVELAGKFKDNFEAYAQEVPKQGDAVATQYLYNIYSRMIEAGPRL